MTGSGFSLVCALREVLSPSVLVPHNGKGTVSLREQQAGMLVEVIGLPQCSVTIAIQKISHLSKLSTGRLTKRCDYLIVSQIDQYIYASFIELKTTMTNEEEPKEQLRRSLPIFEYLISVSEIEYEFSILKSDISISYAIIARRYSERFDKQRVKIGPATTQQKEMYRGIAISKNIGTTMQFNTLL